MDKDLKIVFITAYKDYATEVFEIKAFDYLLKPYSDKRINEVLNNLTNSKNDESIKNISQINKITVFSDEKMFIILLDSIYYIELTVPI